MTAAGSDALTGQLRLLRMTGEFAKARDLIRAQPGFGSSGSLQRLLHEHEDFWWAPIVGKRVTLRRRGAQDVSFVRRCWSDADFMRRFNRLARPLPESDEALAGILARERAGLWSESKALHWTLEAKGEAIGFISATDYAPGHRRCEFLIGLLGRAASPVPVEATHLACDFLRDRAGVERLTAYFYAENQYASKVAAKFGFEPEGVLKGYIRDPDGGRSDLMVSGLLLAGVGTDAAQKRRKRLFT
ncbi:GNAT family N-acetyltransferase [Caenimonas aquaedulcis]|uniref:GNAT family N-acetyltransferase n=1 Tax=Caenimonas aquaedulcis TaxID=2793270 RepID=A0A931H207_9BURK|nr:GNAT family protein [Caenimonas aquaedulcis]MBG9387070.1 GNAT family N-acetyltransferase [Caenimonas aquaedulcis]